MMIINSYIKILYLFGNYNKGILLYNRYMNEMKSIDDDDIKSEIYYNIGKCLIRIVFICVVIIIILNRINTLKV